MKALWALLALLLVLAPSMLPLALTVALIAGGAAGIVAHRNRDTDKA